MNVDKAKILTNREWVMGTIAATAGDDDIVVAICELLKYRDMSQCVLILAAALDCVGEAMTYAQTVSLPADSPEVIVPPQAE